MGAVAGPNARIQDSPGIEGLLNYDDDLSRRHGGGAAPGPRPDLEMQDFSTRQNQIQIGELYQ